MPQMGNLMGDIGGIVKGKKKIKAPESAFIESGNRLGGGNSIG
jgi:hypothetical protein